MTIAGALRAARTWLLHQSSDTQQAFFTCAAQASGQPKDVRGPASSLRSYLNRIDWGIDAEGFLLTGPFQRCHLLKDIATKGCIAISLFRGRQTSL